ncbi:HNH endonuclease [Nocardia goodfellowii]|nr:HNH endonuclease signature motif containing protein [Nocardia goodfellowii]
MHVIAGVVVIGLIFLVIGWIAENWLPIAALAAVVLGTWGLVLLIRHIRMTRYFAGDEFLAHKGAIASFVAEHNELAQYVDEIRRRGTFALGGSASGAQAHLADFQNTSRHKYRRDRNFATYQTPFVHNCSLQVARNASTDPIKYVMKYFNIKATEKDLTDVETLGDGIIRLEDAITNLGQREASITQAVNPPKFIMKHYADEFMKHVGVELSPIMVPYPVYMFEYISAGGNSSQRTTVTLDRETIDAMIETMSQRIKFRKSAAGQRALMTSALRTMIKERDNYTCRYCSISLAAEPHLLLEVDHIVPVSKGGLTAPDNLQTLCWRCNRTKSNKIIGNNGALGPQ